MPTQETPTVFNGRYELQRRLARGGMADVFLARDRLLDRPVALKVLFPDLAADAAFVERFRREAQAAANLNHPNIVSIYDWGQQDDTYFIVMEYIDGASLAEHLRRGPIDPDRAADIAAAVAGALSVAHRHGVIHRDVKPGNVLITETDQVKVADFGIATVLTDTNTDLTRAGTVMGTATYFSPEQAQGRPVDARTDVYSLGAVLYEMLVGAPPFKGDTPLAVAIKHVQEAPVPPRERGAQVAESLEAITLKALAKNADHRYPTADDLRADLRRYLDGMHTLRRSGATDPLTVPTSVIGAVAPADVARTAPAAATAATTALPKVPPTGAAPPVGGYGYPDNRPRAGAVIAVSALLLLALGGLVFAFYRVLNNDTNKPAPPIERAVPQLVGLTRVEAGAALQNAGFTKAPVIDELERADVEPNRVFDQTPKAATSAKADTVFVLKVSLGAGTAAPPFVVGLTVEQAEQQLKERGFGIAVIPEPSLTVDEGKIISQDPQSDQQYQKGKAVTVRVSTGGREIDLPDYAGRTADLVLKDLADKKLVPAQTRENSDTVEADRVIRTEPGPGKIKEGARVMVFISDGPPRVTVPDVSGKTEAEARAALTALGLNVEVSAGPTLPDGDPRVGKVVSQSPNTGTSVRKGSTVSIVIGRPSPTTTTTTTTTTTRAGATTSTTTTRP